MEKPYDAVKTITKKKEIWRLGVLLEDMWTVYKGGTQDHVDFVYNLLLGSLICYYHLNFIRVHAKTSKPLLKERIEFFQLLFFQHTVFRP
jgi:hypothetical protein